MVNWSGGLNEWQLADRHAPTEVTAAKVDELLEHTSAHHEAELAKLQEEEDRKAAAAKGASLATSYGSLLTVRHAELEDMKARKKVLTPEEEALRKAELLKVKRFGDVQ